MISAWKARAHLPSLCVVLSLGALPCPARAELAEPSAEQKDQARALVIEGDRSFEAGNFEQALDHYRAAFALVPVPTVGIEVVKTERALGRWLEARATALSVANIPRFDHEPGVFADARGAAAAAAAELELLLPQLGVRFPEAAVLRVDGVEVSRAQLPLRLNPGRHTLAVSAPGHDTLERSVDLVASERREEAFDLSPSAVAAAAPSALAKNRLASPAAPADIARVPEAASEPALDTTAWIALAALGTAAAAGTTTGILALTEKAKAEQHCESSGACAEAAAPHIRSSTRFGNVATGSFVVAGAAAAFVTYKLFFEADAAPRADGQSRAGSASLGVAFGLGESELSLGVRGDF